MSLEAKIELLTAAVVELTRSFNERQIPLAQTLDETPPEAFVAEAIALQQVVAREHAWKQVPNAETKPSPTTDISPPSSQASVTYDDVKNVTIAVSKMDKSKAVAGLARFGVTTAKALNESQWSDYVAYMKRVAAGEVDPEASHG
jgi:hypothetical protein